MKREQYAVFTSFEEAKSAGFKDAEYGIWQVKPSSTKMVEGWIGLIEDDE